MERTKKKEEEENVWRRNKKEEDKEGENGWRRMKKEKKVLGSWTVLCYGQKSKQHYIDGQYNNKALAPKFLHTKTSFLILFILYLWK